TGPTQALTGGAHGCGCPTEQSVHSGSRRLAWPLFEWGPGIVASVEDEGRHLDFFRQVRHVDIVCRLDDRRGIFWRGRNALELVEPVMLLLATLRNELRGE